MSGATDNQQAIAAFVGGFVDEFVQQGVTDFVVCPGSRSTPLAISIARHSATTIWMHIDERSAAFFALGMAKFRRTPVALVCTSGTAAANFLPAVIEAYQARVPLVVLTADRPHELRDNGAPQTIDQINLYGSHVKWFCDMPIPDAATELVRYARTIAGRAVATSTSAPAGPVHINCPYREPLVPATTPSRLDAAYSPHVRVIDSPRMPTVEQANTLAVELQQFERGLIVCGPQDDPAFGVAVARLAANLHYPVLADPLSGVRCGPPRHALLVDSYDAFLRDQAFVAQYAPEVVVRFGAMPTAKPFLLYLQQHSACRQIVVDDGAGWREPTNLTVTVVRADGSALCAALSDALEARHTASTGATAPLDQAALQPISTLSPWAQAWTDADQLARDTITAHLAQTDELFEGRVFSELAALLPNGGALFAGNSMPVRDLDTFFPGSAKQAHLLANRGANGIDGVVSTALGASAAGAQPLVLVIGDLSFYHDSNGLLAIRQYNLDATIVLINNNGGGIFSFLPQASQEPDHFERLFGTPHDLDFRPLAELYGASFTSVATWASFRTAVEASIAASGVQVIEVVTDRQRNVELHRQFWPAVATALARAGLTTQS